MARRRKDTEKRLIELNSIDTEPAGLRSYLADPSNHVVAKAARIVRDEIVLTLDDELRAAFARFSANPIGSDPGCGAKLALLEALDVVEHEDDEPFLFAARHVQLEPSFEQPIDTAGPLRIRGALGLVRLRSQDTLTILAEHLADHPRVQSGAARALAKHGDPAGGALARLRVLAGIDDGEVLTDCLCAMLALDPANDAFDFVATYLAGSDEMKCHAAALALGEMQPDGAFDLLRAFHHRSLGDDREIAHTAISLMRGEAAQEYLADLDGLTDS